LVLLLLFLFGGDSIGSSELLGCIDVSAVKLFGENCDCVLHSAERDGKMLVSSSDSSANEGREFRRGGRSYPSTGTRTGDVWVCA